MGVKKLLLSLSRRVKGVWTNEAGEKMDRLSIDNHSLSNASSNKTIDSGINRFDSEINGSTRKTLHQSASLRICALIGAFLIFIIMKLTMLESFDNTDSSQCRSIYMFPSYGRIDGFDLRYTPLARKYHLYLYREQNLDKEPLDGEKVQLDGIPVLFIPGNAGSFRQVRSIASSCSKKYFQDKQDIENPNAKNLDFFAADFNGDLTAFHGRTLLDQAEYVNDAIRYILSLYEQSVSPSESVPSSVVVIGHSMGGIVARILPTLNNHVKGSLHSLITLSSPHAAAPVTFDGDILKIYARTNDFWREEMQNRTSFFAENVSLISITGGILDMMLPADYTAVEDILPLENGFTTYSSTIPNVWTSIDHLAVVWCDQLRIIIAKLLLETVDSTTSSRLVPLKERMKISRDLLLSGFENYTTQDLSMNISAVPSENFDSMSVHIPHFSQGVNRFIITSESFDHSSTYIKVPLPKDESLELTVLSTKNTAISFCKAKNDVVSDKSGHENGDNCFSGLNYFKNIPASLLSTKHASDSSIDNDIAPFKMMNILNTTLSPYDYVILEKPELGSQDFFISELTAGKIAGKTERSFAIAPWRIATFGLEFDISDNLFQTLSFTNLWDSLLSYKIHTSVISEESKERPFQPLVRQWVEDPFESKWHVNITDSAFNVNMHNVAPFIPLEETHDKSLKLTFITPPGTQLRVKICINWTLTIKMLFIRYRLNFLSFPISIVSFVLAYQFYHYQRTGFFLDFKDALAKLLESYGVHIFVAIIILSPIVNIRATQKLLYLLDPVRLNSPFLLDTLHMHTNFYFLGLRSWFLSGLGVLFGLVSVAALYTVAKLHDLIEIVLISKRKSIIPNISKVSLTNAKLSEPWQVRIFACIVLAFAVLFYIPYQLASAISLLIQITTCLRVMLNSNSFNPVEYHNLKNYNFSVFLLLFFVVLINCPIIIVFLHNVAIHWETPFRSHHNFLAIAPTIFLVNFNSGLKVPRFRINRVYEGFATVLLLLYLAVFSLLYGSRNLFWIHHLVNILCAWLLYGAYAIAQRTE